MNLLKDFKPDKTGFFRYRQLAGGYLLTNDAGNFELLSKKEFDGFLSGRLKPGTAVRARLAAGGFLGGKADIPALSSKWIAKNSEQPHRPVLTATAAQSVRWISY